MPTPFSTGADITADQPPTRPFEYEGGVLSCEGLNLIDLATEFGTPLYLYSAAQVLHRFALFDQAFSRPATHDLLRGKANSSLALLALLGRRGTGFDIVSGGELERVRRASPTRSERSSSPVSASRHGRSTLPSVPTSCSSTSNPRPKSICSPHRAQLLGVRARFALRVNPDVFAETHPYISTGLRAHKFGIDILKARSIYRAAAAHPSLEAVGVSVHIGSQIRNVEPFAAALERVTELLSDLERDGHSIEYVDIGGGLGIDYGPGPDFDPASEVQAYAAALRPVLARVEAHLLLEPGRFLVAQAGGLLTRVLTVKQNGSKTFVVTDAGMNDLIRPSLYQAHHEILPILKPMDGSLQTVDVVGPVCESGDFFARDRSLPAVLADDLVLLLDAGAYGMSLASNYNTRARPAEILIEAGQARLIRRRETMDDLLTTEILP